MKDEKVIEFPKAEVVAEAPPQAEKIVIFQIVSPNSCIFMCLSADDSDNKLDIGILRR